MTVPWWTRNTPSLPTNGSTVTLNTCARTCSFGSGAAASGFASAPFAAQEVGRVGLARMGQQLDDDVEQLGDAGAGSRRDEADRDQVAFAQRLLERRVQLGGVDVAVVEIAVDEVGIDLDDLLDERAVRRLDAAEVAVPVAVVEAVDDLALRRRPAG